MLGIADTTLPGISYATEVATCDLRLKRETPRELGLRLALSGLSAKCVTTPMSSVPTEVVSSDHPSGTWAVPFRCGGRLRGADPPVQCPAEAGSPEPPSNPLPGGEPPIPVTRRPVFRALVKPKPSERSRRYATPGRVVKPNAWSVFAGYERFCRAADFERRATACGTPVGLATRDSRLATRDSRLATRDSRLAKVTLMWFVSHRCRIVEP